MAVSETSREYRSALPNGSSYQVFRGNSGPLARNARMTVSIYRPKLRTFDNSNHINSSFLALYLMTIMHGRRRCYDVDGSFAFSREDDGRK